LQPDPPVAPDQLAATHAVPVPVPGSPRRAAFAFVFVTVLLDIVAIGVIIPVLPKLVVDFVGGDAAEGARVSRRCRARCRIGSGGGPSS
jgi:hypothetical protein